VVKQLFTSDEGCISMQLRYTLQKLNIYVKLVCIIGYFRIICGKMGCQDAAPSDVPVVPFLVDGCVWSIGGIVTGTGGSVYLDNLPVGPPQMPYELP
jgi:hypothetical protein